MTTVYLDASALGKRDSKQKWQVLMQYLPFFYCSNQVQCGYALTTFTFVS